MIDFGDHTFYIVLAYSVSFLVIGLLALEPIWRARQLKRDLHNFYRRQRLEQEADNASADANASGALNREIL